MASRLSALQRRQGPYNPDAHEDVMKDFRLEVLERSQAQQFAKTSARHVPQQPLVARRCTMRRQCSQRSAASPTLAAPLPPRLVKALHVEAPKPWRDEGAGASMRTAVRIRRLSNSGLQVPLRKGAIDTWL